MGLGNTADGLLLANEPQGQLATLCTRHKVLVGHLVVVVEVGVSAAGEN